jgi:hypothetical protein
MADLAASVLNIAHVACMLFEGAQKTIAYLEEVRAINDPINDLLAKARDLERLTKTVASTYKRAEPSVGSDSGSLYQIRKELVTCRERLEKLKLLAFDLASLKPTTWREKWTVKMRIDGMKTNIEALEQGIQRNIDMLHLSLTCLNVELNVTRRASQSVEAPQAITVPIEPCISNEDIVSISDADTVFGSDPNLQLRRFSTSLSSSTRLSRSSTSSHTPSRTYDRTDSVTSVTELTPLTAKNEWKDIEFHIFKCGETTERIQEIREILQRHSDAIALARSRDTCDRTLLHAAAQRGDVEVARILIENYHADINAKDSKPHSVLDLAVMVRYRNVVALLIEKGVDEDAISTQNKKRFKEMKGAIRHERRVAEKTRAMSRTEELGVVT